MECAVCSLVWNLVWYVGLPLVIFKLYLKLTTGWSRSQVCLVGKTVIVTGANTGIGYETAVDFAKRGARVILACRNEEKAREARDKIIKETDNPHVLYKLVDLGSLKSVRSFAENINKTEPRLDVLVNNAGATHLGNVITADGFLVGMQANYYGPFLLTILLLDLLKKTGSSRVVNVSSGAAQFSKLDLDKINEFDSDWKVYSRSKLCNILFTIELAKRLKGTKVTTYSIHPGVVVTEIFRNAPEPMKIIWTFIVKNFWKSVIEGAQTTIYCAVQKGIEENSGEHFVDCAVVKKYKTAQDPLLASELWKRTEIDLKLGKNE